MKIATQLIRFAMKYVLVQAIFMAGTLCAVADDAASRQLHKLRRQADRGALGHNEVLVADALKRVDSLPDSEERLQTRAYIRVCAGQAHRHRSATERYAYLSRQLQKCADMPDSIDRYERVVQLFGLVDALGEETRGTLLGKYIDRLDKAITVLPKLPCNYLRSRFNAIAAEAYFDNNEMTKSIRADRSQLLILDRRLQDCIEDRCPHEDLDRQRYISLRRLLRNYPELSVEEIVKYHDQITEITAGNPEIAAEYAADPAPHIGPMVVEGNYREALAAAKRLAADTAATIQERRLYLRQLVAIAGHAGDEATKRDADARLTALLEEYTGSYKAQERVRELQLLLDVNNRQREEISAMLARDRGHMQALAIGGGIVLVLLILFGRLYCLERSRRIRLANEVDNLEREHRSFSECHAALMEARERARFTELEKQQLISYLGRELMTPLNTITDYSQMIAENVHDNTRDYIRHFASIVEANTRIIQEIANDIQEFTTLENGEITIHEIPTDINRLAEITADSVKPQLNHGTSITVRPNPGDNNIVTTDPRHLQIALLANLMSIVRHTRQGEIILTAAIDREARRCTLTVTSGSAAMPAEELKTLLESRMIINALKGDILPDPAYSGPGVSIAITIPIK